MKFYSLDDKVITLNENLDSTNGCHYFSFKADQEEPTFVEAPKKKHGKAADVNVLASMISMSLIALKMKRVMLLP